MGVLRNCAFSVHILLLLITSAACSRDPGAREAKALERGRILLEKRDYSRALLEFKNATQARPTDAEPFYQAGIASLGLGDVRSAATYFRKATQLDPKHAGAQLKI